jgi:polyhydroxyalkanoate synthesis regulator phasin
MENRMEQQMQRYWRWRASKRDTAQFRAMASYQHATAQDRTDLEEGNLDWQADIAHARMASQPSSYTFYSEGMSHTVQVPPDPSRTQRDLLAAVDDTTPIPGEVDRFFDDFVHDSHAGFWLLGPVSQADKNAFANEIRKKNAQHAALLKAADAAAEHGMFEGAVQARQQAERYALNHFEQRVLAQNPKANDNGNPATIPLMTDKEAADLRASAGFDGWIVRNVLGTATRREANGPGHYRRVFDRDHERLQLVDEAVYQGERLGDAAKDGIDDAVESARQAAAAAKERAQRAAGQAVDNAIDAAGRAAREALESGLKKIVNPSGPSLY